VGPSGRLAYWRYTAGRSSTAERMVLRLATLRAEQSGAPAPVDSVCPSCGGPIRPEDGQCPACAAGPRAASVSVLFRLISFARPHFPLLLLGSVLTTAATAASLLPPYLTMFLIDGVLTPHQKGEPADFGLVPWYLGGLLGAAVLTLLLDWARTYTLARTGEVVCADLRARTYTHLQRMSLEFFGGKRRATSCRVSAPTRTGCATSSRST
jgi:ATP-binding cassette subfamily B protein